MWFDILIQQLRASDRMLACQAMKNHLTKNSDKQKFTCICSEASYSPINSSLITGLICALTASSVWAILATWRPAWLKNLREKSTKLVARFLSKSKECNPETGMSPSDQTPASQEPGATTNSQETDATTNSQEAGAKSNSQEPAAITTLKVRRPRNRICPYRRTEKQLRRQIKEETFEDLRRLIRIAKIEANTEVEEEMRKFEASAPEVDSTTLFDDH